VSTVSERRCWQGLTRHREDVKALHLRELFAADPGRGERFVAEGAGLYLDYSKNQSETEPHHDSSTNALIRRYRATR